VRGFAPKWVPQNAHAQIFRPSVAFARPMGGMGGMGGGGRHR
jgi:hypothetical protein